MDQCMKFKDSKCSFVKTIRFLFSLFFVVSFVLLGCGTEQKVKRIEVKLKSPQPEVRRKAALALAEIGKPASSAVPSLIDLLKDEEDIVCGSAAFALSKIEDPNVANAIPELIELSLGDRIEFTQRSSLDALVSLRELAVPELIPLLTSNNDLKTRLIITEALSRIGSGAKEATTVLMDALYDSNEVIRENVISALGRIDTPEASRALDEYKAGVISSLLNRVKNIREKIEMLDSEVNTEIEKEIASLVKPLPTKIMPKGEFENRAMYEKRVKETQQKDLENKQKYEMDKKTIQNSAADRINDQSKKYQNQLASLRTELILDKTQFEFDFGKYDAEKEIFPNAVVKVNESSVVPPYRWQLAIPLDRAKTFKESVIEGRTGIQVHIAVDHEKATARVSKVETVDLTVTSF